jgi:hypothetical protein
LGQQSNWREQKGDELAEVWERESVSVLDEPFETNKAKLLVKLIGNRFSSFTVTQAYDPSLRDGGFASLTHLLHS